MFNDVGVLVELLQDIHQDVITSFNTTVHILFVQVNVHITQGQNHLYNSPITWGTVEMH